MILTSDVGLTILMIIYIYLFIYLFFPIFNGKANWVTAQTQLQIVVIHGLDWPQKASAHLITSRTRK